MRGVVALLLIISILGGCGKTKQSNYDANIAIESREY